jgi:hypothetical protein
MMVCFVRSKDGGVKKVLGIKFVGMKNYDVFGIVTPFTGLQGNVYVKAAGA